jgi:hypothetical protein
MYLFLNNMNPDVVNLNASKFLALFTQTREVLLSWNIGAFCFPEARQPDLVILVGTTGLKKIHCLQSQGRN